MKKQLIGLGSLLLAALLPTVTFASSFVSHCDGSTVTIINNSKTPFFVTEYEANGNTSITPPSNLSLNDQGTQIVFKTASGHLSEGGASGHVTIQSQDGNSIMTLKYIFKASLFGEGTCHAHIKVIRNLTSTVGVEPLAGDGNPASIVYTLIDNTKN